MVQRDRPFLPVVRLLSLLCAALVILMGVIAVVSWQLLSAPRDPFSDQPIDAVVALAFLVCGVALLLIRAGWWRLAAVLGGGISLAALLVFLDDVLEVNLGIDLAALETLASARPRAFVAIAPTILIGLAVAGAALAVLGTRRCHGFVAAMLGTLVGTLGLAAFIDHRISGLPFEWFSYAYTEPINAIGLLVLGIGIVTAALDRFDPESEPADWAVPLAIGTTTLLIGLVLWHGLRAQELRQLERSLNRQADALTVSIRSNLELVTAYLAGFPYEPGQVAAGEPPPPPVRPARAYFPGLYDASWIDVADTSAPAVQAAFAGIPQLQFLEGRYESLFEAEGPIVSGPATIADGVIGFRIILRRDLDEQSRAFLSGMIAASTIFSAVPQLGGAAFDVMVLSNEQPVFLHGDIQPGVRPPWGRTLELGLPGPATWELIVAPRSGLLDSGRSVIPELVLGASLLIAVLLTALTRTAAQARHGSHLLQRAAEDDEAAGAAAERAGFDRLVATISHEIRNPVAVIRNVVDLQSFKSTDADERARLNAVLQRQSDRILDVLNAMLDLQIGAGSTALVEMQDVDLARLVESVVDQRLQLRDGIAPAVALTREQTAILVKADRERLRRAFRNLLDYATRQTPARETVEVEIERASPREAYVTIRDRGPDLGPGEEETLFSPHAGGETASPRTMEGALMLTAAKRIVEFHGGSITARRRAGGGLELHVSLPAS